MSTVLRRTRPGRRGARAGARSRSRSRAGVVGSSVEVRGTENTLRSRARRTRWRRPGLAGQKCGRSAGGAVRRRAHRGSAPIGAPSFPRWPPRLSPMPKTRLPGRGAASRLDRWPWFSSNLAVRPYVEQPISACSSAESVGARHGLASRLDRASPGPMRCHSTWPRPSSAERSTTPSQRWSICLRRATASRRVGGHLGGELERRLLGGGRGRDAVDEAHPQRLVGADVARGEQQVLRGRETAERHQAGRADRNARAAPGKRIRRLEPPTRRSQATAISAPPPTTEPWQAATVGFGKAVSSS